MSTGCWRNATPKRRRRSLPPRRRGPPRDRGGLRGAEIVLVGTFRATCTASAPPGAKMKEKRAHLALARGGSAARAPTSHDGSVAAGLRRAILCSPRRRPPVSCGRGDGAEKRAQFISRFRREERVMDEGMVGNEKQEMPPTTQAPAAPRIVVPAPRHE